MNKIFNIAKYTVKEALRDKFYIGIFIFILLSIPLGIFLKSITLYGNDTVFGAVFFAAVYFGISLISILYVVISLKREIDSKMISLILSKPVSHMEYLLGKHLGFILICLLYIVFSFILIFFLKLSSVATSLYFLFGLFLMQWIIVAFSMLFALLLDSMFLSITASFLSWIIFNIINNVRIISLWLSDSFSGYFMKFVYYIMPDYSRFDFRNQILYNLETDLNNMIFLIPYAFVYTFLIIIFSWIDFFRKEY